MLHPRRNVNKQKERSCKLSEIIDLQLGLSKQSDVCNSLEEQEKLCKDYEAKMNHYSRWLCYCNILPSAGTVYPQAQDKDLSGQVLDHRILNQLTNLTRSANTYRSW